MAVSLILKHYVYGPTLSFRVTIITINVRGIRFVFISLSFDIVVVNYQHTLNDICL